MWTQNPFFSLATEDRCERLLSWMVAEEVIDSLMCHQPRFFLFNDRPTDDGDWEPLTLESEMDAERFRNFIATSVEKEYYPIAAVVIFDEEFTDGKPYQYLDKILEVPQWKNGHLVRPSDPQCSTCVNATVAHAKSLPSQRNAVMW